MKLLLNKKPSSFIFYGLFLFLIIYGFKQKASIKLLGGSDPVIYGGSLNEDQVKDYQQNFNWFYKAGGINSSLLTPDLMFDVGDDFCANIDTSNWTVPGDTGLVFYYSIGKGSDMFFTYLITNAYHDRVTDSIIPIGLYDNLSHSYLANKYLLLNENQSPATTIIEGKQDYVTNYVANVYMNQITDTIVKIDTLPLHPHLCFYNTYTLYNFYNDNRLALSTASIKKIMVKHGAMDKGLLLNSAGISNCKVQIPVLIFSIDGGPLLGNEAYLDSPFKNHALDIGNYCPPGNCSCY